MDFSDIPNRLLLVFIAVLVVLTPVVLLTLTLAFLTVTTDIAVQELTLLELVELYLLDLVVLVVVGYLLYRLVLRLVVHELPPALEELEEQSTGDSRPDSDSEEK